MAPIHHRLPLTNVSCQPPSELASQHSPARQTILNFTKWQVSPLAAVSQSVWNQFPEVWCKPELHNFCLLAHDWWWDRSVFNQRYLGPLESWNKMFYCREQFLLRQSWMNGELYSNTVCFYQLQEAELLIDSSESVIDISINFHFIKTFSSLHSAAPGSTSDVSRENQIIKTIFYYTNPRV